MTILLHKPYVFSKSDYEGGGDRQKYPKNDHVVYGLPLTTIRKVWSIKTLTSFAEKNHQNFWAKLLFIKGPSIRTIF